jgi:hypothetical protein
MRTFLIFLLFPLFSFSQTDNDLQLPDSNLASVLKVKKLIILRCENGTAVDTEAVYLLNGSWKYKDGTPIATWPPQPDPSKIVKTKNGSTAFINMANPKRKCYFDTVGFVYKYDLSGKLNEMILYSCEKGNHHNYYNYDTNDRLILMTCTPDPNLQLTREEFKYNNEGQLVVNTAWYTENPLDSIRSTQDSRVYQFKYDYSTDGLIRSVLVEDPYNLHGLRPEEIDGKNVYIEISLRYIYIY